MMAYLFSVMFLTASPTLYAIAEELPTPSANLNCITHAFELDSEYYQRMVDIDEELHQLKIKKDALLKEKEELKQKAKLSEELKYQTTKDEVELALKELDQDTYTTPMLKKAIKNIEMFRAYHERLYQSQFLLDVIDIGLDAKTAKGISEEGIEFIYKGKNAKKKLDSIVEVSTANLLDFIDPLPERNPTLAQGNRIVFDEPSKLQNRDQAMYQELGFSNLESYQNYLDQLRKLGPEGVFTHFENVIRNNLLRSHEIHALFPNTRIESRTDFSMGYHGKTIPDRDHQGLGDYFKKDLSMAFQKNKKITLDGKQAGKVNRDSTEQIVDQPFGGLAYDMNWRSYEDTIYFSKIGNLYAQTFETGSNVHSKSYLGITNYNRMFNFFRLAKEGKFVPEQKRLQQPLIYRISRESPPLPWEPLLHSETVTSSSTQVYLRYRLGLSYQ